MWAAKSPNAYTFSVPADVAEILVEMQSTGM